MLPTMACGFGEAQPPTLALPSYLDTPWQTWRSSRAFYLRAVTLPSLQLTLWLPNQSEPWRRTDPGPALRESGHLALNHSTDGCETCPLKRQGEQHHVRTKFLQSRVGMRTREPCGFAVIKVESEGGCF